MRKQHNVINHEISGKNFVIYPNIIESKYDFIEIHIPDM